MDWDLKTYTSVLSRYWLQWAGAAKQPARKQGSTNFAKWHDKVYIGYTSPMYVLYNTDVWFCWGEITLFTLIPWIPEWREGRFMEQRVNIVDDFNKTITDTYMICTTTWKI